MLSNILFRRSLSYFYRLVKPNISEFNSIEELEFERKQRELVIIQQHNLSTLQENKSFTKEKFIISILNTSQEISQEILKRHLNFSVISPKTLKHHTLEKAFADSRIEYPFSLKEVETSLPDLNAIPMHFSYKRGAPVLNEYEMDKKIAYVFNLPEEFSTRELSEKLGVQTVKQIKVEYCRLGLPAYAKVHFNTDEAVNNLVLNNKTYIQVGNRVCFIKTHFDREKLELKNRRLVIHDLQENEEKLIFELSQYGRVVHLDYPTFITRNPSLEQVRETYKNSDTLIKINHHKKDGSIESEFYPSLEETFRMNTFGTTLDFYSKMVEKKQKLEAMYKNRMRYAQEIDVYQGKENEICIKNMGFCIVTYSCTEEAQNCYFNLRFNNRIQLFDAKTMEEFEVDQGYRKRILRLIDSEYQRVKQKSQNSQTIYEKQVEEYFDEISMFDKLVDLETQQNVLRESVDEIYEDEPEVLISYFNTRVKEIKKNLEKKLGSKSFDELAELQLFGRVLPKHDPTKPKISIDAMQQTKDEMKELLQERGIDLTPEKIKERDSFYLKKKAREIKRMSMDNKSAEHEFAVEEDESRQKQVQHQDDAGEDYSGQKNYFSTVKKRTANFRNRTSLELANYILRYCEYIRSIINEYQGVFSESRFSYKTSPTFLNPESIYFSDSIPYIVEEDLPKFLECMRTFDKSQKIFTQFWKDYEFYKSKSININEYRHSVRNNIVESLRGYFDEGCVKEVYEVEDGEDVDKKVLTLNATIAGFGQEFKTHVDENGNKIIIKIAKVESICPLDKLNKISKAKAKFDANNNVTPKQLELFEKYKYQIIETGEIPSEVRKEFNISEEKTLDDLFEELAADAGIYKKDIEMLLNLDNFTEEQIAQDVGLQLELEKVRMAQKQSRASDYAKDPYNIEVRDKEGYFKVSKFRQI